MSLLFALPACILQPTPQSSDDSAVNALDLEEAIRSLDSVTAALVTEVPEEEVAATVAAEREAEEKKEREEVEMRRSTRSHKASKEGRGAAGGQLNVTFIFGRISSSFFVLLSTCI